ncbi:hypothetical protein IPM19_01875 [bacterium]|nr:MAG: hypothetical protein IPM19_01875 [bacterium]
MRFNQEQARNFQAAFQNRQDNEDHEIFPGASVEFEAIKKTIQEYLRREHKINEGNNGVIFKIELDNPDEGGETKEFAGKLLKVGDYNSLHNEYLNQKQAYDILEQAIAEGADPAEYAKIPVPYFCDSFEADEGIKKHLEEEGVNIGDNNFGLLLMDWVDGRDVATHLFKRALELKESRYLETIQASNFNQLHQAVSLEFDFARPGGKATREGDRIFEQRKIEAENEKRIYTFLKKKNYTFPKETVQRIKNTIDLLKANGLNMWDSHARNIMIDDNEENPYLIDFAPQTGKGNGETLGLDPYILVRQLEALTTTIEEEHQMEAESKFKDWSEDYDRHVKNSRWRTRFIEETANGEVFLRAAKLEIGSGVNYVDDYIFALCNKVETGKIEQSDALQMLQELMGEYLQSWRKAKIEMAIKKASE